MSQFHRLLAVKFPLLAGQHESHESVSSPESKEHEPVQATIRLTKNVPDVTLNSSGHIMSKHLCTFTENSLLLFLNKCCVMPN